MLRPLSPRLHTSPHMVYGFGFSVAQVSVLQAREPAFRVLLEHRLPRSVTLVGRASRGGRAPVKGHRGRLQGTLGPWHEGVQ